MPKTQQECVRRDYQAASRDYNAKSAEAQRLAVNIDQPGGVAKAATAQREADALKQRLKRISDQIQNDCP
ncbi:hypothetical protein [Mesorhizobium sp.]|uniref:hypothetical protein n=1 Tax=Mesorhizobium sp. TaxID=1871066 RepID=UPI000FE3A1E9|nr:hypothetical protein [Mesorhizobium sp.]RWN59392.1 MAG: hypothetical protein EOR98_03185 [Mesorhizobium sp.]RWN80897.1 MAG: hypothetical protein EOS02_03175 [Mesorhizobium sp.]RWN83316.1 MAG: hypothetical protein EOS01_03165 [Mesorhizobium sp.]RWN86754.1 MAG: hypothetical protein EOS04_17805 [Mesorhizobium sp.]RWO16389.1 MAG: hypothetical protein EOS15_05200 [Mesorhizobium sp.]